MKTYKSLTNLEIAELLRNVAASYEIKDADKNKFRIIAYNRAADSIEHLSSELKDLWDEGKLTEVASIGSSIARHLDDLFRTGKSEHFVKVMSNIPPATFELMKLAGVGPKTSYKLVRNLNIYDKDEAISILKKACEKNKVALIEGFGEESQKDILRSINEYQGTSKRMLLSYAWSRANEILEWLRKSEEVLRADPLGSLRRKASTIGDIDIAVATKEPEKVLNHFVSYPKKTRVIEKGEHSASIMISGDIQIDLMVQDPDSYGALLQHFTGSKHHNIALREYALRKGLSLSEYGIRKLKANAQKSKLYKFKDEESFYQFLGLEWIPPELREDTGEIEAAENHNLPRLIETADIKADLQIHTNFDIETSHDLGESSMEDLIIKANQLGYEYIAFTDHNPSKSAHSEKQIINILRKRKEKIEQLNSSFVKSVKGSIKKVFNSLEVDVLPQGELSIPLAALDLLDFVLVSIHSSFRQGRDKTTKRILKALSHPKAKIFAHPTARKLTVREGVELDWPSLFDFCKTNGKWLEINADPSRLDLPDFLVKDAVKFGVKMCMGTDSHHISGMDNMQFGVSVARRGWATKNDIINCVGLKNFEKLL